MLSIKGGGKCKEDWRFDLRMTSRRFVSHTSTDVGVAPKPDVKAKRLSWIRSRDLEEAKGRVIIMEKNNNGWNLENSYGKIAGIILYSA